MSYSTKELEFYMNEALKVAERGMEVDEIPVGCVIVNKFTKQIESAAHNETNFSRNGTRHCEIVALERLINKKSRNDQLSEISCKNATNSTKENINQEFHFNFGSSYDLFVTVEPCIMCIGFVDQVGIKNIFFGCKNDRFGGCGSVLNYHTLTKNNTNLVLKSGICEDKAIKLLRNFYELGNPKAPENKRKRSLKIQN